MSREQLAKDNGMTIEFVNWFFEKKKDGCGNVWFMMMAAMWEGYQAGSASMQAERDQLAAECAALKKSIPPLKMVNDFDDSWDDVSIAEEVGFNHAISTILRNFPETPATDRFLAEQRAVGVEMVAAYIKQSIQHLPEGDRLAYHDAIELCSGAAAQLRNEVNHG